MPPNLFEVIKTHSSSKLLVGGLCQILKNAPSANSGLSLSWNTENDLLIGQVAFIDSFNATGSAALVLTALGPRWVATSALAGCDTAARLDAASSSHTSVIHSICRLLRALTYVAPSIGGDVCDLLYSDRNSVSMWLFGLLSVNCSALLTSVESFAELLVTGFIAVSLLSSFYLLLIFLYLVR